MLKICVFLKVFLIINYVTASLSGPYLLWGHEKLRNLKVPALTTIDEKLLSSLYSEAKSVVLFIRNNTNRLDSENYPSFKELVARNSWAYFPQLYLPAEPSDYNSNVEIITLVGPPAQQDIELAALYKDAVTIYGEGEVLGILASQSDEGHFVYKREADDSTSTTSTTASSPTDEPIIEDNFIYRAPGKAILYTTSAPTLNITINENLVSLSLLEHDKDVTFDDRNEWSRLNIGFKVNNSKLRLRFNFTISSSNYWSLTAVEVAYKKYNNILFLNGEAPTAPIGFSYKCASRQLQFKSENDILAITDFQVQPWLNGASKFSDAYDCIGFTTVPIWSGIFVSFVIIAVTFIGILALMEIKTPNRFESTRNKQLTFTVQD